MQIGSKYKITIDGQEIDENIKDFTFDFFDDDNTTSLNKFKGEYTIKCKPKIELTRYACGVSKDSCNQSFITGSILFKNYNFILLYKGVHNKDDFNSTWSNLVCHIYSQLNVMRYQHKISIMDRFNTNDIILIETAIKSLFVKKWENMFNMDDFYKNYKWLRITYKDIYDTITSF